MEDQSPVSVDVIIVNYRSYDELARCLASLESNRTHLGGVTVIDHESDLNEAARITQRFPWANVVECSTNDGFATGVNLGARLTRAPFLLLLNPDCVADDRTITGLLQYA